MRLRLLSVLLLGCAAPVAADESARRELGAAVLERYASFSIAERQTALAGLVSRPDTARMVLEAIAAGRIPRSDLSGFAARSIAAHGDAALTKLLETSWGRIAGDSPTTAAAAAEHAALKARLTPATLARADRSRGRLLFKSVCATCHTLFDDGGSIGPNLTGSNRADLDYLLENITNPSAVLGKDYELHTFVLADGRAVAGMIRRETPETFTVQTIAGEELVPRAAIRKHDASGLSMMPTGLLTALDPDQARDLVAYLASPSQVPLPGEGPPPPAVVPGAIEGESLTILSRTGEVHPQDMRPWKDNSWSGGSQLWWTGAKPGDQLTLALPVASAGTYNIAAVLTRAPDYGVMRFLLDGRPLGSAIDCFGSTVTATPELVLGKATLTAGDHRLTLEITGANPQAIKAFMAGLDYVRLERVP